MNSDYNLNPLMSGPIGHYCFCYTMKDTQEFDMDEFNKMVSPVNRSDNEQKETVKRVLAASFLH